MPRVEGKQHDIGLELMERGGLVKELLKILLIGIFIGDDVQASPKTRDPERR
jgi:hypothetical protein